MAKSPDAFRTISEVAEWLDTPAHVLRFWESKFAQVKPVKRAGGRRYYRPDDMALLGGIKALLHDQGLTIKGAQKLLREKGIKYVASLGPSPMGEDDADLIEAVAEDLPEKTDNVVAFDAPNRDVEPAPAAAPETEPDTPAAAPPEPETAPDADAAAAASGEPSPISGPDPEPAPVDTEDAVASLSEVDEPTPPVPLDPTPPEPDTPEPDAASAPELPFGDMPETATTEALEPAAAQAPEQTDDVWDDLDLDAGRDADVTSGHILSEIARHRPGARSDRAAKIAPLLDRLVAVSDRLGRR